MSCESIGSQQLTLVAAAVTNNLRIPLREPLSVSELTVIVTLSRHPRFMLALHTSSFFYCLRWLVLSEHVFAYVLVVAAMNQFDASFAPLVLWLHILIYFFLVFLFASLFNSWRTLHVSR